MVLCPYLSKFLQMIPEIHKFLHCAPIHSCRFRVLLSLAAIFQVSILILCSLMFWQDNSAMFGVTTRLGMPPGMLTSQHLVLVVLQILHSRLGMSQ